MPNSLTESERQRIRYHLGYLNVAPAASISYGMARPIQTLFIVDTALDNLLEESTDQCRRIVGVMDGIEETMVQAMTRFAASKLDNLELRSILKGESETDALEREYTRWAGRLSDILGAPIYPYSTKFAGRIGGGLNVPVSN
jgi:hypothetical protein